MRQCRTCHPGADHGNMFRRHNGGNPATLPFKAGRQTTAFTAKAGALFAGKSGPRQAFSHGAHHGVGRRGCTGLGQPRQRIKQLGLPLIGVAVGGGAIQIKRIHSGLYLRQTVERFAQHQGELHPATVECDAVKPWRQHRPVRQ